MTATRPPRKLTATAAPEPGALANPLVAADESALRRALAVYRIDTAGDVPDLIARVREYIASVWDRVPEGQQFRCVDRPDDGHLGCGEHSTSETDFCPFCGDGGEGADKVVSIASAVLPAAAEQPMATHEELADEFDAAVAEVDVLCRNFVGHGYDLGKRLREIEISGVWKSRYSKFTAFLKAEVKIGVRWSYALMKISDEFDRATFLKIGAAKLALVAAIKDGATKTEALAAADGGASTREVKDIIAAKSPPKQSPKPRTQAPTPEPAKPAPEPEATVALLGRVGAKPVTYAWRSTKTGKPIEASAVEVQGASHSKKAAKVADDEYVEIPVDDTVSLQLQLKIERNRIVGVVAKFMKAATK